MPQGEETFAGALESLEARCRSETRSLYESEGKTELLGEDGVPDSLRAWLEESRGRVLGDGGHREGARRRLREQVGTRVKGFSSMGLEPKGHSWRYQGMLALRILCTCF